MVSQGDCQAICHDVYDADAFVIVYSITDEVSLKVAKKEVEAIRSRSAPYTPVLLLGNKLDLDHARKVGHCLNQGSATFRAGRPHSLSYIQIRLS